MKALLLILALSCGARAQDIPAPPPEQSVELPPFTEGLYTRYGANSIPDAALAEALNVVVDEDVDGVVVRRRGSTRCNTTAVTNTKTLRGLWSFDAADGTRYQVTVSSADFYQHSGDCVWTAIPGLTSYDSSADWDCVQGLGKFWCTNGATGFWWDGSSTATVTGMPAGTLIDTFRNRILVANVSANQSRIYLSGELDGTDYTLPTTQVSTSPAIISIGGVNDGRSISCMMGAYGDVYFIGKRDSLYGLYGFDTRNFEVREISREVGCIEDKTVQEKNNKLYWLSQRGVERMNGPVIERVSDPVRDLIDNIIATAGNERSVTDTLQADFQAGNLTASGPGGPISATIIPNSITPTSWSVVTTGLDPRSFEMVDVDTTVYVATSLDNFDDNDLTGNITWTQRTGNVYIDGYSMTASTVGPGSSSLSTPSAASTGTWSFTVTSTATSGNNIIRYYFMSDATDWLATGAAYRLNVEPVVGRVGLEKRAPSTVNLFITSEGAYTLNDGATHYVTVSRGINGYMRVLVDGDLAGSATDTAVSSSTYQLVVFQESSGVGLSTMTHLDSFRFPAFYSAQASVGYDAGLTTPTFSYQASYSSASISSVTFNTQTSATQGGTYSALAAIVPDAGVPSSPQRRFLRHQILYSAPESASVSTFTSVTLTARTTGYFNSQCFSQPSTNITSWDKLSCAVNNIGGSVSFFISTGTSCDNVTTATATWNSQANNSFITVDTAAYVAYRALFTVDAGTDAPNVADCTISWNEGQTRPPAASAVYRDRYHLAYTSNTASGAYNDHQLVLDRNDKWTLFDGLNCYSLGIYERALYCGSSTSNGLMYQQDIGTDDDGAAFTSRFRTKAYSFGRPDMPKEFREFGAELESEPDSSYNISTNWRYYVDRGTTPYSVGPVDLGEDPGYLLWAEMPFSVSNPVRGRYIQMEGEVSGTNSPFRFYKGVLKWRPLRGD